MSVELRDINNKINTYLKRSIKMNSKIIKLNEEIKYINAEYDRVKDIIEALEFRKQFLK